MSSFTTQIRYICESLAGYDASKGYMSVDNIIDKHFDETKDGADYLDRRLAYVGINYKF